MCEQCGMTFYHNSNLKKHMETVHAVQHKVDKEITQEWFMFNILTYADARPSVSRWSLGHADD